jgi:hypothetical protein
MELNGALSNPFARNKGLLITLNELRRRLLEKARMSPQRPRSAPPRPSPVLETLTLALASAAQPMRARELHAAAEQLAGRPLLRTSVKAALAAGATGDEPRFQRLRYGVYAIARHSPSDARPS